MFHHEGTKRISAYPQRILAFSVAPLAWLPYFRWAMKQLSDLHIVENTPLPSPEALTRRISPGDEVAQFVHQSRLEIARIIRGEDSRMLLIVGPCSIHDTAAGLEYAKRLKKVADEVRSRVLVVMRVYFEKPRTQVGWKGLIMDPNLDGSCDIPTGLEKARSFLCEVLELGLPTGTEFLDPITPQYIADLVSWAAIGARTTESQTHRQMASGLSMPLGFKNTTAGDIIPAINAVIAASHPQTFLGVNREGIASSVSTKGNPECHLILRGGSKGPNYDRSSVATAIRDISKANLTPRIMVDCSHDNSKKDHTLQAKVIEAIQEQRATSDSIMGAMLESNLVSGNQDFPQPVEDLTYGQSITDACIDWDTTEEIIRGLS